MPYTQYGPRECLIHEHDSKGNLHVKGVNHEKAADSINARFDLLRIIDNKEYFIYIDGIYCNHAWEFLESKLYGEFAGIYKENGQFVLSQGSISEVLNIAFSRRTVTMSYIELQKPVLNMKQGLLDLNTFEIIDHSPEVITFDQSPIRYDPGAKCPRFLEFLGEVLEPQYIPTFGELFGWTLWPEYHIHQAIMLYGPRRAGKGTVLRVLQEVIGNHNCSNQSLQDLCNKRFATSRLFGMKANIYGDLPQTPIPDAMMFKALTGGDPVDVEKKGKDHFTLRNKAKMWFAANTLPEFKKDDAALYGRWKLIPFKKSFYGQEDPDLTSKLTTPEELSGILNWSLEGLRRLRANNWRFGCILDGDEVYKKTSKPYLVFLEECCETSEDGYIPKADLLSAYNKWATQRGLPPITSKIAFGKIMMDQTFIPVEDCRRGPSGNQIEAWAGIRFKN